MLGRGVRVGPGRVGEFEEVLALVEERKEDGDEGSGSESDSDEEGSEGGEEVEEVERYRIGRTPSDFPAAVPTEDSNSDDDEQGDDSDYSDEQEENATLNINKLVGKSVVLTATQLAKAKQEIRSTVQRAILEDHEAEDCFAEIKTTKMAENMGWKDVRAVVVQEVMGLCGKQGKSVKSVGERWGGLLGMLVLEKSKGEDGVEVLLLLQVGVGGTS